MSLRIDVTKMTREELIWIEGRIDGYFDKESQNPLGALLTSVKEELYLRSLYE